MKDAPKTPDDFAMVLTNAEGIKKKNWLNFTLKKAHPNN